jgi:hypothetical protein
MRPGKLATPIPASFQANSVDILLRQPLKFESEGIFVRFTVLFLRLMPLRTLFILVLACSMFALDSCGSSKPIIKNSQYEALGPGALDTHFFHSPVGDIAGHYPAGWLLVNTEVLPEFQNLLFLYTDRTRTNGLVLSEIPGSAELRRNVERDGLLAIAQASIDLKTQKPSSKVKLTRAPELFAVKNKLFAGYEYTAPDSTGKAELNHRAVVFTTGVRFYELTLVELAPNGVQTDQRKTENFRLLQSVIGALEGVVELKKMEMRTEEAAP